MMLIVSNILVKEHFDPQRLKSNRMILILRHVIVWRFIRLQFVVSMVA
jgi:hypothetical protein